jgi:hypothetical protein
MSCGVRATNAILRLIGPARTPLPDRAIRVSEHERQKESDADYDQRETQGLGHIYL